MSRQPFNPDLISGPAAEPARTARGPLTVSQVTALVKQAIETALPPTVHVVGEISNFKRHSSGHLYFTLKDRFSELGCVMWSSSAAGLKFAPTDGLEVVATGAVEVFERAGRYQLYVRKLEPRGVGALELAFQQLCEKLSKEGLFDERHKRPLPAYPSRIALLTSPTGAAIADMLLTIERRYPCVHVLIYAVRVQGPGAADEIAAAIRSINDNDASLGGIDLAIVGRGGGSLEDLWAFNEETLARAIFASRIPVISAVGHEVDVTIADLVADVRAATPTAAAELAVPVLEEVLADLSTQESRLSRAMSGRAELLTTRVSAVLQRAPFREPVDLVRRREQIVDELSSRMHRSVVRRAHGARRLIDTLEPVIQRIAPHTHLLKRAVELRDAEHRLRWAISTHLARAERPVSRCERRLDRVSPENVIPRFADRSGRAADALSAAMRHRLSLHQECLRRCEQRLKAMGYQSVLGRGFSISRTKKGRVIVRSLNQLNDGQRVVTQVTDGEFESEVVNLKQLELFG
ncbi:MAG: exodeoxyribonuclease VII large subunit [Phycisphaerales bacterium]|nr:MAG: exodeoxyribonuclease VII large subunit [Phycisphaerales bacterium]